MIKRSCRSLLFVLFLAFSPLVSLPFSLPTADSFSEEERLHWGYRNAVNGIRPASFLRWFGSGDMASGENPAWFPDYGLIDMDDVGNFARDFPCTVAANEFYSALGAVPGISPEVSGSFEDSDCHGKSCQHKRSRAESCGAYGSKASREKMRRDKLNDRFMELGSLLESGKKPKTDKTTILCDAIRIVNQLRNEAEKLKEEHEQLEEKAEKSELREEKVKLKADRERLEQQIKAITMPGGFLPHPAAFQAAFAAQAPAPGVKPMPFMGYPAVPMWQFLPPALVDSSKDPAGVSPGA